jgi:hypothetical protein
MERYPVSGTGLHRREQNGRWKRVYRLTEERSGYRRGIGLGEVPVTGYLGFSALSAGPAPDAASGTSLRNSTDAALENQQISPPRRPPHHISGNRPQITHGPPAVGIEAHVPTHGKLADLTQRPVEKAAVPVRG